MADVEGDADLAIEEAGLGDAPSVFALYRALTGLDARFRQQPKEGELEGEQAFLKEGLSPARARFVLTHETAHVLYKRRGFWPENLEEWCDALAAALACRRRAYRSVIARIGHRVHELAHRFGVTQSVALLRIGETEGRPVMLLRHNDPIVRGAPFVWPSISAMVRMATDVRGVVHPIRISDEPDRVGFLATHDVWRGMGP